MNRSGFSLSGDGCKGGGITFDLNFSYFVYIARFQRKKCFSHRADHRELYSEYDLNKDPS